MLAPPDESTLSVILHFSTSGLGAATLTRLRVVEDMQFIRVTQGPFIGVEFVKINVMQVNA